MREKRPETPLLSKTTPSPANPARKLDILLHNGHALGVQRAEIRVFEQMHQKRFGGFLQGLNGVGLPP